MQNAILDGEIVALNDKGTSSFKELQDTLSEGKIFVDYLRNELTSTAVAAFSARARRRHGGHAPGMAIS